MVDVRATIPYQHQQLPLPRNPMATGLPAKVYPQYPQYPQYPPQHPHLASQHQQRRTSSSNTFPQNLYSPRRASSTTSSVSSTTTPSPSSQPTYVSQLRRQKATVWCSQSQAEDPRIVAAQKAEKARASQEISGASTSTSSLFGGNGHHGHEKITSNKRGNHQKNVVYAQPSLLIAAGLPARLSASEVEGDGGDDDVGLHHHPSRSSLARSHGSKGSTGSATSSRRGTGIGHHNAPSPPRQRTASSAGSGSSQLRTPTVQVHPGQNTQEPARYPYNQYQPQYQQPYQQQPQQNQNRYTSQPVQFLDENRLVETPAAVQPQRPSTVSGRNEEAGYFTGSSGANSSTGTPGTGDLKRRGSVDENDVRTLTMSGVRLFVANPD